MSAEFSYDRALTRIKYLTIAVGLVGTAAMFFARGREAAVGFLAGAGLSYVNFELLSGLAFVMGGSGLESARLGRTDRAALCDRGHRRLCYSEDSWNHASGRVGGSFGGIRGGDPRNSLRVDLACQNMNCG